MKIQLSLKETHLEIIEDLKKINSDLNSSKVVEKYIKASLLLNDDELIFGTEREQCRGGCYSSRPQFEIEIGDHDYHRLKNIYKTYGFNDYETEDEEISKTIRCILNFIDDEPNLVSK